MNLFKCKPKEIEVQTIFIPYLEKKPYFAMYFFCPDCENYCLARWIERSMAGVTVIGHCLIRETVPMFSKEGCCEYCGSLRKDWIEVPAKWDIMRGNWVIAFSVDNASTVRLRLCHPEYINEVQRMKEVTS